MIKRGFAPVAIACISCTFTEARVTRIELLKMERVDPSSGAPGGRLHDGVLIRKRF